MREAKEYKIFEPNTVCYALISSLDYPKLLLPVKAKVLDVEFDYPHPKYSIKVLEFFDDLDFLKKYVLKSYFYLLSDLEAKKEVKGYLFNLNTHTSYLRSLRSKEELNEYLTFTDTRVCMVVNSLYVFETEEEMFQVFSIVNDYIIEQTLYDLYVYSVRDIYDGKYNFKNENEFLKGLETFLTTKTKVTKETFQKFLKSFE